MTDDLVKRLRDSFTYDQQHYAPDPLVAEAADRIERLEGALLMIAIPRVGGG